MNKLLIILLFFCSCKEELYKEGDILFQQIDCGPLCDAINKVTDGYKGKDYNHCALVVKSGDSLAIVEAIGDQVSLHPISKFYDRVDNDTSKTLHMRLKNYRDRIPQACSLAQTFIGQKYDDVFLLDNNQMYCSEVLYEAFKKDGKSIFTCQPMTYKDPDSMKFFKPWVDYYESLHAEIPEGKMGLNPGGVSKSEFLEVVE